MKFQAQAADLANIQADLVVIVNHEGKLPTKSVGHTINKSLDNLVQDTFDTQDYKGGVAESQLFQTHGKLKSRYVLYLGLGSAKDINLDHIRKWGAAIYSVAAQLKASKVVIETPGEGKKGLSYNDCAQAVVEGLILQSYQFTRYKEGKKNPIKTVILSGPGKFTTQGKKGIESAELVTSGVCLARDLVNTPGRDMTPKDMADHAKKIKGITTKIHDLAAIRKMKMGAYLSVAEGSSKNPPYFIEMHYKPKGKAKKKVAIVGKGVTFDTGGYSLKPPKGMENMKDDMAGGAAVIGLMSIIAKLAPKVEVSGYIAATENMVDGFAQRPGDVCTAMNGTTIEVLNTDAEGRLTLADALHYANQKKPDYIIDMATLTGACLVALGMQYAAGMTNDPQLLKKVQDAGTHCGENIWELPLVQEYRDDLKSTIADLKNIGSGYAGTITAGLFLQHFVGDTKWLHLDIAGPAFTSKPLAYTPSGGTGFMVRTLAQFLNTL